MAKNTAYSVNLLTITDEYLSTISSALQQGLKTVASAGSVSQDKLAVMQKNLNDKLAQVDLLIKTADFDGKSVLSGGAIGVDVQVGLSITDKITLNVKAFSAGKLLRIGAATAINDYLGAKVGRVANYATSAALTSAVANNNNFAAEATTTDAELAGAILASRDGSASFARLDSDNLVTLTNAQVVIAYTASFDAAVAADGTFTAALGNAAHGAALAATAAATAVASYGLGKSDADVANDVQAAVAVAVNGSAAIGNAAKAVFETYGGGVTVSTANVTDLGTAIAAGGSRAELTTLFSDNQVTTLDNAANRSAAQDVLTSALNAIRGEQAAVSNQRSNVVESADALRATTNVTQKAADSYLKTDYVMTAQQYSETIRTMVASITALQAANKIPEAAQRLIDALTR